MSFYVLLQGLHLGFKFFLYFSIRGNVFATGYVGGLIKPSIIEYGLYFLSWTGRDSNKRFAKAEIQ